MVLAELKTSPGLMRWVGKVAALALLGCLLWGGGCPAGAQETGLARMLEETEDEKKIR